MTYVADLQSVKSKLETHVGESQECVAAVKSLAGTGPTWNWRKGKQVKGNTTIREGTAIATFREDNTYYGHAAIYIRQSSNAIHVYDQWVGRPLREREIVFKGFGYVSNDGEQFYAIE
ncbi:MAG: BPSL0067 family protein [Rhodocyclales bacterium]|nr:BPSL0067 family protein [Rhodocyclales bacterium]